MFLSESGFILANHVSFKRLFFAVAFVIGDSQNLDRMCGRYLAYANVTRSCCACYLTHDQSDNPFHKCKLISMTDVN